MPCKHYLHRQQQQQQQVGTQDSDRMALTFRRQLTKKMVTTSLFTSGVDSRFAYSYWLTLVVMTTVVLMTTPSSSAASLLQRSPSPGITDKASPSSSSSLPKRLPSSHPLAKLPGTSLPRPAAVGGGGSDKSSFPMKSGLLAVTVGSGAEGEGLEDKPSAAVLARDRKMLEQAQREIFMRKIINALNSTSNGPKINRTCVQAAPATGKPSVTGYGSSKDCAPGGLPASASLSGTVPPSFIASFLPPAGFGGGGAKPFGPAPPPPAADKPATQWTVVARKEELLTSSEKVTNKNKKKQVQGQNQKVTRPPKKVEDMSDAALPTNAGRQSGEIYAVAEDDMVGDDTSDVITFNLDRTVDGGQASVSKAELMIYVRYRKKAEKNAKKFINLTVYRVPSSRTYGVTGREDEPLASMRVPLRHTRWHKLLLPTSIIQETINKPRGASLSLRLACSECSTEDDPTVVLRHHHHTKKSKKKHHHTTDAPSAKRRQRPAGNSQESSNQQSLPSPMTETADSRLARHRRGRVEGSTHRGSRDQRLPYLIIKMAPTGRVL